MRRSRTEYPAKMAHGLLSRIIWHGFEQGWWAKGDLIGDPFGGIGTTGILCSYNGLRSVSVELEPRFVELAQANFALHRAALRTLGEPEPIMLQGDSRQFAALVGQVGACVTSPPYSELGRGGPDYRPDRIEGTTAPKLENGSYGSSPGQIGRLPAGNVDACLTSPPYVSGGHHPDQTGSWGGLATEKGLGTKDVAGYGTSEGQIGKLPPGCVDSVITSPPYADQGTPDARHLHFDANRRDCCIAMKQKNGVPDGYGSTPGNLDNLKQGSVDAVLTSPPYAESIKGDHGERETAQESRDARRTEGGSLGQSQRHGGYGASPGNIGNLKEGHIEGVITSPPWEGSLNDGANHERMRTKYPAWGLNPDGSNRMAKSVGADYGRTDGQIGNTNGETYWQACAQVYAQVMQVLKPGGVMCVVVKSYVKAGKLVDLPGDTLKLLLGLGFAPVERIRAMLRKDYHEDTLFAERVHRVKRRESFFRNLARVKAAAKKFWPSVPPPEQQQWLARAYTEKPNAKPKRLLEMAQVAAYKHADAPEIENPTEIKWEEVLVVRKAV